MKTTKYGFLIIFHLLLSMLTFAETITISDPKDVFLISPCLSAGFSDSGWDFETIEMEYDRISDLVNVTVRPHNDCILGDVECDGDEGGSALCTILAGGVDLPNLSGLEAFYLSFDLGMDNSFDPGGDFSVYVGIGLDVSFLSPFLFATSTPPGSFPLVDYGTFESDFLFTKPSPMHPELFFTLDRFSERVKASSKKQTSNFCIYAFMGSVADLVAGEDFIPYQCLSFSAALDYGDIPDTYKTLEASTGAKHIVNEGFFLGSCVDDEGDGVPSTDALGDDTATELSETRGTCTGADDEDGVTIYDLYACQEDAVVDVSFTNTTSLGSFLDAWIDFNGDGSFSESERITVSGGQDLSMGTQITFDVPCSAVSELTYARFRLSEVGGLPSDNSTLTEIPFGEVEDYSINITGLDSEGPCGSVYETQIDLDSTSQRLASFASRTIALNNKLVPECPKVSSAAATRLIAMVESLGTSIWSTTWELPHCDFSDVNSSPTCTPVSYASVLDEIKVSLKQIKRKLFRRLSKCQTNDPRLPRLKKRIKRAHKKAVNALSEYPQEIIPCTY